LVVIVRCGSCRREAIHGTRHCVSCRDNRRAYCQRNRAKRAAATKAWKKANPKRVNAHNRRYNAAHPELAREWRQGWVAAHPESMSERFHVRRARKQGQFIEKVYKTKLIKLKGAICGICGEPVDPRHFQVDHIVPFVHGGEHSYANCQPAHGQNCRNSQGVACNQVKATSARPAL
jgi:5-methylcytosine-specific restriction endonuclease McrA